MGYTFTAFDKSNNPTPFERCPYGGSNVSWIRVSSGPGTARHHSRFPDTDFNQVRLLNDTIYDAAERRR